MGNLVLLTGISGFIAKHVAVRLLNAGYAVRGTLRRMDRADEVRQAVKPWLRDQAGLERLSFVQADLEADAGWDAAMAGVQAVLHTASPFPIAQPASEDVLIRPAVDGTARVLSAAARAGIRRVVLTSSIVAVVNERKGGVQDERDWCDLTAPGTTAYAKSKTMAEQKAWEIAGAQGLSLTTINPGLVLGPPLDGQYGSSLRLVERILKGRDPMLPDIGFAIVDVRDVAEMHLRALQNPGTAGKRYLASAGSLGMPAMGRILKAEYPVRRIPTRTAPALPLRALSLWDADVRSILPRLGTMDRVSNHAAVTDMGMAFVAPELALKASADWLVRNGRVWA